MNRAKSARVATETTTFKQWQGFQPWGVGEDMPFLPSERRAICRDNLKQSASQVKHRLRLLGKLDSSKPNPTRHRAVYSNVYDVTANTANCDRIPYYYPVVLVKTNKGFGSWL